MFLNLFPTLTVASGGGADAIHSIYGQGFGPSHFPQREPPSEGNQYFYCYKRLDFSSRIFYVNENERCRLVNAIGGIGNFADGNFFAARI